MFKHGLKALVVVTLAGSPGAARAGMMLMCDASGTPVCSVPGTSCTPYEPVYPCDQQGDALRDGADPCALCGEDPARWSAACDLCYGDPAAEQPARQLGGACCSDSPLDPDCFKGC